MKKIKLFFIGLKGYMLSLITLFFVMIAVLLVLNYSFSQYLFINRSGELFGNGHFDNGLYFQNITPYDQDSQIRLDESLKSLEGNPCVKKVTHNINASVHINNENYQLELYDQEIYPDMYGTLPIGDWKSMEDGKYCVVIGGVIPKDVPVGETVVLKSIIPNNSTELEVKISGALAYPPMILKFGYYSSDKKANTADKFYIHDKVLYLPKNDTTLKIVTEFCDGNTAPITSGVVKYIDSATEKQKEEVKNIISENAAVLYTDTILESTKSYVSDSLRKILPTPSFLLLVSALSYISIAVLSIYKKKDYTIYYITGCNKQTMHILASLQVNITLLITTITTCVGILILKNMAAKGMYSLPCLIFGWQNVVLTCSVALVIFLIVVFVSSLMLRRFSPVEQLKLTKE